MNVFRKALLLIWIIAYGMTGNSILFAVSYSYDSLNRLTKVDYANGAVINYTYDAVGNRLTIQSSDSTLNNWRKQQFSSADLADPAKEATVWGDTADPDHDGRSNLLEYAIGSDPNTPDNATEAVGSSLVDGQKRVTITFKRRKNDPSLQYLPEVSSDMRTWTSGAGSVEQIGTAPFDTEFDLVTYADLTPVQPGQPRFIRLRVSRN